MDPFQNYAQAGELKIKNKRCTLHYTWWYILFIVQRCSSRPNFAEPLRSALMQGGTWNSWNSPSQSSTVQPSTPVWLNKKKLVSDYHGKHLKRVWQNPFPQDQSIWKKTEKKNMDSRKYPNYQHTFVLIWKSMSMPWCCPWEREIHVRKHRWPVPWFPPKFGPTNWTTTRLESCRSSCPSLPIIDGVVILKRTRSKGCQRGKWMQPSPKTCKVTSPILQILHCQESAFGITKRFSRTSFSWAADSLRWSKSKTNKIRTQNVIFAWSKTYSFHEIDQNTNLEYVEIHQVSWSIVWLKYVAVSATVPYLTLAFAHSCAKIAN